MSSVTSLSCSLKAMGVYKRTLFSTGKKKEFSQATDIHKESLTVLDFVLTSHSNQKLFVQNVTFKVVVWGGKVSL